LPRKEAFKSEPEYYSTLLHEATHSTGAKKRLDRFGNGTYDHSFGSQDYSKEELVAEMGSAFLCAKAGISQPVLENQEAYIKGWLKALENDARLVISAGSKAQKAYDHILGIE
jgi:antirestriction protein ArdC